MPKKITVSLFAGIHEISMEKLLPLFKMISKGFYFEQSILLLSTEASW